MLNKDSADFYIFGYSPTKDTLLYWILAYFRDKGGLGGLETLYFADCTVSPEYLTLFHDKVTYDI